MAEATTADLLDVQQKTFKKVEFISSVLNKNIVPASQQAEADREQATVQQKMLGFLSSMKDDLAELKGGQGGGAGGGGGGGIMGMLKKAALFALVPLVLAFINSESFKKLVSFIKDTLIPAIKGIWDWLKLLFDDPKAALIKLWDGIKEGAANVGEWLWNSAIVPFWDWLTGIWKEIDWKATWDGLWSSAKSIGQWLWDKAIVPIYNWIVNIWKEIDWKATWDGLWSSAKSIGQWLWDKAIVPLYNWIVGVWKEIDWKATWDGLWSSAKSIGQWLWDKAIVPIYNWIVGIWKEIDWKATWDGLWSSAKSIGQWLWDKAIVPIYNWIVGVWKEIDWKATWDGLWSSATSIGQWLWDKSIKPLWDWIGTKFTDFTANFAAKWKEKFPEEGGGFWGWVWSKTLGALWNWIKLKFNNFKTKFTDMWVTHFPEEGGGFWGWVWSKTLGGLWGWIKEKFNDFQTTYVKPWTDAFKEHGGFWEWVYAKTLGALFTWLDTTFKGIGTSMQTKYTEVFGEGGITGWIWDHTIGGLFDWMKQVLDIDWGDVLTSMVPDWVKNTPGIGKFFGGESDEQKAANAARERIENRTSKIQDIGGDIASAQGELQIEKNRQGAFNEASMRTRNQFYEGQDWKNYVALARVQTGSPDAFTSEHQAVMDDVLAKRDKMHALFPLLENTEKQIALEEKIAQLQLEEKALLEANVKDSDIIAANTTDFAKRASEPQSIYTHDTHLEELLKPMPAVAGALLRAFASQGAGGGNSSVVTIVAPQTSNTTAAINQMTQTPGTSNPMTQLARTT